MIACSARRPFDSLEVARAACNQWWPPTAIATIGSSLIVILFVLSYLVTHFARLPCAAKLDVELRPEAHLQQVTWINQHFTAKFDITMQLSITTFELVAFSNIFS